MRITFDTNILVSAFEFPKGRAIQVLHNIRSQQDSMFISQPMIEELLRVLSNKFGRTHDDLQEVRQFIQNYAHLVTPTQTLNILTDEPDNRILECALATDADLIVTGDRAMLELGRIGNSRIVSLADYLSIVDNSSINR